MRLQKYISLCGIASRREAEKLITLGLFHVNKTKAHIGMNVKEGDIVTFKDRIIETQKYVYYKLYKPTGYITSSKDQFGRKIVTDLLPKDIKLFSIGRLDYNTSGLLLLTNDGQFANDIMHPRNERPKTYLVTTKKALDKNAIKKLEEGVIIDGYKTMPSKVEFMKNMKNTKNSTNIKITITEGKNRQIRKMVEAVGTTVIKLHRESIGSITLENLKSGEFKKLTKEEMEGLKNGSNKS